jgi:hypothetical protein
MDTAENPDELLKKVKKPKKEKTPEQIQEKAQKKAHKKEKKNVREKTSENLHRQQKFQIIQSLRTQSRTGKTSIIQLSLTELSHSEEKNNVISISSIANKG